MYKKQSLEERLLAVQKCLEGYAPRYVGRAMVINEHCISEWRLRYDKEGIPFSTNKQTNLHFSSKFARLLERFCKPVIPSLS